MIDVKTAVRAASDHLRYLYENASDIRLEEVELVETPSPRWNVTLSFMMFPSRVYKQFEIDPDTSAVKAMRIRQPA